MAFDPRHAIAGLLTFSMFAMLGNMIKQDHFDSIETRIQGVSEVQLKVVKVEEPELLERLPRAHKGPWKESSQKLQPCWSKPDSKAADQPKGFVTFSLTSGPEHHISEITDTVVIARYLGATLVLPDIRGSELGQRRNFNDVYDEEKFLRSLDGVVKVVREIPAQLAAAKPAVVKVPNRVTEDFILKNIEPIFRAKGYLRLAFHFSTVNMKLKEKGNKDLDSTACLAMFGSLELKPEVLQVADQMVERLRTLGRKSDSKFVAVDLRIDTLEQRGCKVGDTGRKSCYNAQEIGDFLKKIGFEEDTAIYLTQTWWHESLDALKAIFPKTYTKDDIIPSEHKGKFLQSGNAELERALDLHICSKSDAFVPAISGLFYGSVTGKRIASGRTQIFVPADVPSSSAKAEDFISTFVSKKNHLAYGCHC